MSKNITKRWLKKHNTCTEAYEMFCGQKERDEIKVLRGLIKIDRLDWANWLIARRMKYKQYVRYAVYAAKQVLHIYEERHSDDDRPRKAIEAAQKCIKNPTKTNKKDAADAADAAYASADAADASAAAYASAAAADAADAAYAAYASASDASAAYAAYAAYAAASASAVDKKKLQLKILKYGIKMLKEPS